MKLYFLSLPQPCTNKYEVIIEYIYFEIQNPKFFCFFNKGTTLRLDTWDGWVKFLQGCLLGHRLTVQSHLSQKKPVMRSEINNKCDRTVVVPYISMMSPTLHTKVIFFLLLFQVSAAGSTIHRCIFRPLGSGRLAAGEGGTRWRTRRSPSIPPVVPWNSPQRHRKVSHPYSCRERSAPHPETVHHQENLDLGLSGHSRSGPFESCSSEWSQGLCALFSQQAALISVPTKHVSTYAYLPPHKTLGESGAKKGILQSMSVHLCCLQSQGGGYTAGRWLWWAKYELQI